MRKTTPNLSVLALAALVLPLLAAAPAAAVTYTVTLTSGDELLSRYPPREMAGDPDVVLLLSEVGNWIALARGDIESVITDIEAAGFGKVIDTTTIDLGLAPNDNPIPEEAGEVSQLDVLRQALEMQRPPERDFTVEQFVDPGRAGQGGLPVGFAAGTGFAGGGQTVVVPPAATSPPQ